MSRSEKGPARKVYNATQLGQQALDDWVMKLRATVGAAQHCLDLHIRLRGPDHRLQGSPAQEAQASN